MESISSAIACCRKGRSSAWWEKNKSSTWAEECVSQQAGARKGKVVLGEAFQCSLRSSLDWRWLYIYMWIYLSIMVFCHLVRLGKQWWEEVIFGEVGRFPSQTAVSQSLMFVSALVLLLHPQAAVYQEKRYSLAQIQAYSRDGMVLGWHLLRSLLGVICENHTWGTCHLHIYSS